MVSYSQNYTIISSLRIDGDITVNKYQSKRTGMKICIADVEGPLVHGYLTVATEAHDDDGLPHTLEHLVFMGSESYPYKGVLDLLANRCLASGTNAITSSDYTYFSMETVGSEGFLNLLPVYLDHLLYPTLTNEAFITEVHHISGEGEDGGVVYCEMQASENSGGNLCSLALYRAIYPGVCGYKSEVGGLMKNLRESTTNKKIRDYHSTFYRPDNLCVVISGQIEANDVFKAVFPIEEKIIQKGTLPKFTRPWQSEVPPLPSSVKQVVSYPCDDNEDGMVLVAWRGPLVTEIAECTALNLLFRYLSYTSVSPLQRDFIEIDDPFCTDITTCLDEYRRTCLNITFSDVPRDKLHHLKDRLLQLLSKIANGEEEFDLKRMSVVVHNEKVDVLNQLENSPHSTLRNLLIRDFLYGNTAKDLEERLQQVQMIDSLANKDASFWQSLIRRYFLERDIVTIIGEPSTEMKEKMMEEEKARIAKQKENLGPDGLKSKDEELKEARKVNDIKPPKELLMSVPLPSIDSIKFYPITRSCNYLQNMECDDSLKDLHCCFQLDVMNTKFVNMLVLMDTSSLPLELRFYLPLFTQLLMELPVVRNGTLIQYREVVKELDADTLERGAFVGLYSSYFRCGELAQLTGIALKVEQEKYQKGINWLHELLYKTKFTKERIQVMTTKMIKTVSTLKRNGTCILNCLMSDIFYNQNSNHWTSNVFRQLNFLKNVQKLLKNNPENVISNLETLRNKVGDPANLLVHMTSNIKKLGENPLFYWKSLLESPPKHYALCRHSIKQAKEFWRPLQSSLSLSSIAGIGSVESCYFEQAIRCIYDYRHPDLPALMVLLSYLTQLEGPLWRLIRGQGLAYSYDISLDPTDGILAFSLCECTSLVPSYKEAKTFIENLLEGKEEWETALLESSRSCLIYETIDQRESSICTVSYHSLLAYYCEMDRNYTRYLLTQFYNVSTEDLIRVGKEYLLPLFDTTKSCCAICCNPSKVEEIVDGFKKMSRDLTVIKDVEDSFLASI